MKILGREYSSQIEGLYLDLKKLSKSEVVFDHNLTNDTVFGTPRGSYHTSERPPRISLKQGAREITVAHELLHGILEYEGYPGWAGPRERWAFALDTAHEVCHCAVHTVIDSRLLRLGYDVPQDKALNAQQRKKAIGPRSASARDEGGRIWWSIRIACQMAYHNSPPAVAPAVSESFAQQAEEAFPASVPVGQKLGAIVGQIDVRDRRNVQATIRSMLKVIEEAFPGYAALGDISRKVVVTPMYITRSQLAGPANRVLDFVTGTRQGSEGLEASRFVVLIDNRANWAVVISEYINATQLQWETQMVKNRLSKPLRNLLKRGNVRYLII